MTKKRYFASLEEVVHSAEEVGKEIEKMLEHLSTAQLNWKPNSDEWSVGQCIDHIIKVNSPYFPIVKNILAGKYQKNFLQSIPFLPGFWGNLIINAVKPETAAKVKARPNFVPTESSITADIVKTFQQHQNQLLSLMKKSSSLPLESIIVTSPVAGFVTYDLYDAYSIITAHEQRHFQQAKRVIDRSEFPK
ncbi:MAG: DinB family protein [Blastocatellia bacterium]|nr:DinB family protein [Blastocatellia bacterium]